jgi:hypothetical protein
VGVPYLERFLDIFDSTEEFMSLVIRKVCLFVGGKFHDQGDAKWIVIRAPFFVLDGSMVDL